MSKTTLLALSILFSTTTVVYAQATESADDKAFDAVEQVVERKNPYSDSMPDYKDDRSTPTSLIKSFYNAINRGEFSRAYSYHDSLPEFPSWVLGYKDTRNIKLRTGDAEGDPGAGVLIWYQPVAIEAEHYNGKKEVFGGCYRMSLGAPANQEIPPFQPMTISTGSLKKSNKSLEDSVPKSCMPE